jgi:hypothetical protein
MEDEFPRSSPPPSVEGAETMSTLKTNRVGAYIPKITAMRAANILSLPRERPIFLTAAAALEGSDPPKPLLEARSHVQSRDE